MVIWFWTMVGLGLAILLAMSAAYDRRAKARGQRLVDPDQVMSAHMARIQARPETWFHGGGGGPG